MPQQIIDLSLTVEDDMPSHKLFQRSVVPTHLTHEPSAKLGPCGVQIAGSIVLLCTGFHARTDPTIDSVRTNPLLTVEATRWSYDRGSRMHGVKGPSADKPTDDVFGNFGVPPKGKGGSGSPVRAFAIVQAEGGIDRV